MVSFRALFTAAMALAPVVAQTQFTAITSSQVVINIQTLTNKSLALQGPANQIDLISGPLVVIGQGPLPIILAGFTDIIATASAAIVQMKGMGPVPAGPDSDAIFDAFRIFIRVHQELLSILIGKAGLFNLVPFIGAPVTGVLQLVEGVVDTIALTLVNNVQSHANEIQQQLSSFDLSINVSVKAYGGILAQTKAATPRALKAARREIVAAAA